MATKSDFTKNEKIIDLIDTDSDLDNLEPNLSTPHNSTFGLPKKRKEIGQLNISESFLSDKKKKKTTKYVDDSDFESDDNAKPAPKGEIAAEAANFARNGCPTPPLTACTPAPARRIVDPATGKAFVNVTLEVYKRSKEESLDLYGYRVPRAQHEHFIQENESFVVYCREDDDLDRFSYRLEEGEFGRIGFFKKEAQK